jgi:2-polyprenyl-3-methyl-5-hydroxy-6-metoxy-1,4-benzoquinol methylase
VIYQRPKKVISYANSWIQSILSYILYYVLGTPDGLELPPPHLMWLSVGTINAEMFLKSGEYHFNKLIVPLLRRNNVKIDNLHAVLDFGCGCGRLTRWFRPYAHIEIWGTDFNEKAVQWCQDNLAFANFLTNQSNPPLNFSAEKFDLILIRSVFTHITEKSQKMWLREFHRITTSNGIILLTVHGNSYLDLLTPEESLQYRKGNLVIRNEIFEGTNKCAAFHPPDYLYKMLPDCGFEILDKVPGELIEYGSPQDMYLAMKIDSRPSKRL